MLQTFGVGKHSKNHIDSGMSNLSWNFLGWNQTRNCTLVQLFVQLLGIVKYQTKNGKNNLTISQVKRLTFALKVTQNQEFCPYSEIIRSERVLFRHITVLIKFWALVNAESCVIFFSNLNYNSDYWRTDRISERIHGQVSNWQCRKQ